MIEVIQAGQAGKTKLLLEMHRLRKRVFKDRLKWDVTITPGGLEVDQFDLLETVYMLAVDQDQQIVGSWRLSPASGPNMIRNIWPQFLSSLPMPADRRVWEISRFVIDCPDSLSKDSARIDAIALEMFCGLSELCVLSGIKAIYGLYDMRVARLMRRLRFEPDEVSDTIKIDGHECQVGCFRTASARLAQIQALTNYGKPLITENTLPPVLRDLLRGSDTVFHAQENIPAFAMSNLLAEDA